MKAMLMCAWGDPSELECPELARPAPAPDLYRQQCPAQARRGKLDLLLLTAAHKFLVFTTFPLRSAAQASGVLAARTSYGEVVLVP
jgi:hypothetical protein